MVKTSCNLLNLVAIRFSMRTFFRFHAEWEMTSRQMDEKTKIKRSMSLTSGKDQKKQNISYLHIANVCFKTDSIVTQILPSGQSSRPQSRHRNPPRYGYSELTPIFIFDKELFISKLICISNFLLQNHESTLGTLSKYDMSQVSRLQKIHQQPCHITHCLQAVILR